MIQNHVVRTQDPMTKLASEMSQAIYQEYDSLKVSIRGTRTLDIPPAQPTQPRKPVKAKR